MAYPPGSEFTQLFYSRAYGNFLGTFYLHQFSSVAQSCPAPCDPINRSTPSLPVCHQLPEFTQTHVHSVGDAIQASHPLSSPSPPASPSIRVFSNESTLHIRWPKYWSSALASVLPMNIQDWSPLGLSGLISLQPKGLSRVFSPTPQFKSISSLALSLLYSPTLTSIHDYWKNHSFDQMDLCWQSNVSAFYVIEVAHSFSFKEQASFNFMAAVTICSDLEPPQNSLSLFPLFPHLFAMKRWDWMPWS